MPNVGYCGNCMTPMWGSGIYNRAETFSHAGTICELRGQDYESKLPMHTRANNALLKEDDTLVTIIVLVEQSRPNRCYHVDIR
jgi:hypothetical protein